MGQLKGMARKVLARPSIARRQRYVDEAADADADGASAGGVKRRKRS